MKNTRLFALLCLLIMLSCKENKTEAQDVPQQNIISEKIASSDFRSKTEDQNVQLIDVRTPKEFNEGHINKAKNIDFFDTNFLAKMSELNKDAPLYIYCRSGNRSGKAAAKLKELGFKEVYDLKGGVLDWKKNDLKLVQ